MNAKAYRFLFRHWLKISRGSSYYHLAQSVGRHFDRHEVKGYYNDLTGKTEWKGETNGEGIPVTVLTNGVRVRFPITIAQMALGAYDLWLETGRAEWREKFLTLAGWFERNQDERGGWMNPWAELRPSCLSGYSAMAQGEAISVLVRAYLLTANDTLLDRARRGFALLARPIDEGGCSSYEGENLYLEEFPERPRSTVLNGWIFAAFGLYDLAILTGDLPVKGALAMTLATLEEGVADYDTGYWSLHDRRGTLASPFYHRLHIALLDALFALTDIEAFAGRAAQWRNYEMKTLDRTRAILVKMSQKLKHPDRVMIAR